MQTSIAWNRFPSCFSTCFLSFSYRTISLFSFLDSSVFKRRGSLYNRHANHENAIQWPRPIHVLRRGQVHRLPSYPRAILELARHPLPKDSSSKYRGSPFSLPLQSYPFTMTHTVSIDHVSGTMFHIRQYRDPHAPRPDVLGQTAPQLGVLLVRPWSDIEQNSS